MSSSSSSRRVLIAVLLTAMPVSLQAQGPAFLAGVFSNITDINGSFLFGSTFGGKPVIGDSGSYGLRGLALEVSFDLGVLIPWGKQCPSPGPNIKEVQRRTGDSVVVYQPKSAPCESKGLRGELGLGYSQLGRFRGQTVPASGAIEELPFVTFYGSIETDLAFTPYAGLRAGLVQLKDLKTSVAGAGAKGTGSTFEYGMLAGLGFSVSTKATLFVEAAWTYRTFDGIDWAPATVLVPASLLQPLKLDTRTISLGIQLEFKKPPG